MRTTAILITALLLLVACASQPESEAECYINCLMAHPHGVSPEMHGDWCGSVCLGERNDQ